MGRGTGATSIAILKQLGLPTDDAAADLNHDWVISENTITDSATGMQITALTDSQIVKNTQSGGRVGISIIGGKNIVYQKNTIVGIRPTPAFQFAPAGAILRSVDSAVFSQNLICSTAAGPALRFAARTRILSWLGGPFS